VTESDKHTSLLSYIIKYKSFITEVVEEESHYLSLIYCSKCNKDFGQALQMGWGHLPDISYPEHLLVRHDWKLTNIRLKICQLLYLFVLLINYNLSVSLYQCFMFLHHCVSVRVYVSASLSVCGSLSQCLSDTKLFFFTLTLFSTVFFSLSNKAFVFLPSRCLFPSL
jgi:hypothetical protein